MANSPGGGGIEGRRRAAEARRAAALAKAAETASKSQPGEKSNAKSGKNGAVVDQPGPISKTERDSKAKQRSGFQQLQIN